MNLIQYGQLIMTCSSIVFILCIFFSSPFCGSERKEYKAAFPNFHKIIAVLGISSLLILMIGIGLTITGVIIK